LQESFLIGDNEEARIETTLGGQPLTLLIRFVSSGSPFKTKARMDWNTSTPGTVKFTAYDWENPLGTAVSEPIRLGEIGDGRPFGFQVAQSRVGNTNRVDFFLLVSGEYGKPDKVQT
jgi:hypothetical protein